MKQIAYLLDPSCGLMNSEDDFAFADTVRVLEQIQGYMVSERASTTMLTRALAVYMICSSLPCQSKSKSGIEFGARRSKPIVSHHQIAGLASFPSAEWHSTIVDLL
ncbi:hypothetical protein HGRIS_001322 [Hohenbuehelia grisea]|uniref:Uncharacterized protein n=1 Tax=Hohenbuehelia grisea TaxID=104357 RepID=A0ABR3JQ08_9AGAR